MATKSPSESLNSWFMSPNPGYAPLSQVSFAPAEPVGPHQVQQFPSPSGIVGNTVAGVNKLVNYPAVQQIFNAPRTLYKF